MSSEPEIRAISVETARSAMAITAKAAVSREKPTRSGPSGQ
jgi:hypothetical protein